ncbi:hypothetical protein GB931_21215 [Modestobacter sp. I12A-02628]|uniref:Uncharacterized protein n=1 Tax=Goekera deserti TaxID=2497753 RepID=A0A7K3WG28_9ACTN|nr:hypothetical protein [Goekera deserti]MPR00394.1 hypothetical protein [Goekera deserti]NDI50402.1 hypothetical protein [Goekera deserti]NEL55332.1 hypothetical protein [Goekera deserti]
MTSVPRLLTRGALSGTAYGVLGGLFAGAVLGTAIVPVLGTLFGAGIGFLVGLVTGPVLGLVLTVVALCCPNPPTRLRATATTALVAAVLFTAALLVLQPFDVGPSWQAVAVPLASTVGVGVLFLWANARLMDDLFGPAPDQLLPAGDWRVPTFGTAGTVVALLCAGVAVHGWAAALIG